jgi:intracellular sulfur oxidation DsrE/DsrF family protein
MLKSALIASALSLGLLVAPAWAGPDAFHAGTAIPAYGKVADVPGTNLPADTKFKVSFDVGGGSAAEPGKVNRSLEGAARFINMHVASGIPAENIQLALVVHGKSGWDLTTDEWYKAKTEGDVANANAPLIAALVEKGVTITLCGQTGAWHDISEDDLLPGVTMSLSAMTAHALLQQQGYTLNPF